MLQMFVPSPSTPEVLTTYISIWAAFQECVLCKANWSSINKAKGVSGLINWLSSSYALPHGTA